MIEHVIISLIFDQAHLSKSKRLRNTFLVGINQLSLEKFYNNQKEFIQLKFQLWQKNNKLFLPLKNCLWEFYNAICIKNYIDVICWYSQGLKNIVKYLRKLNKIGENMSISEKEAKRMIQDLNKTLNKTEKKIVEEMYLT